MVWLPTMKNACKICAPVRSFKTPGLLAFHMEDVHHQIIKMIKKPQKYRQMSVYELLAENSR